MAEKDIYKLLEEIIENQKVIIDSFADLKGDNTPKVFDLTELQKILHVSKRTIAKWLSENRLPHSRVGAKIWVSDIQLQKFLDKNKV